MSRFDDELEKELARLEEEKKKKKNGVTVESATQKSYDLGKYSYLPSSTQLEASDLGPVIKTGSNLFDSVISGTRKSLLVNEDEEEEEPEDDGKLDFFQKGTLSDGYQFGDISKAILGTVGDVGINAVKGIAGIGEGIADLIGYGIASGMEAAGDTGRAKTLRKNASESAIDALLKKPTDYLDQYSVLGRTSDSIAQGIGQVGAILATGGLGAAAGMGTAGVTALTTGVVGVSGMGSGMGEAYKGGATDEEAWLYGAISGAADALSELLFGGLGKAVNAVGLSKGLLSADDMLAKKVSGLFKNQIAKNFAEYGIKAGAEGLEEVFAGVAQAVGKKMTYMSDTELSEILQDENLLEQFVVGAVTSGIAQAPSLNVANKAKADFITGMTENDQAVVKKEVENRISEMEKDGKKLTSKEKADIEAKVEEALERGEISLDTIEEVLGGDDFTALQDTVTKENEALAELAELYEGEELQRHAESLLQDSKRGELQKKLRESVFDKVKDSKLGESYREDARYRMKFDADLNQYGEKERAIVQKAIESGVLNNSRKTHEFVDFVAKVSSYSGIDFDFTSNQKLKETGFVFDGNTTNGFYDPNTNKVVINSQSKKYLHSLVGHEVTHALEGSGLYESIEKIAFEYAKQTKEYKNRLKAAHDMYSNKTGYTGQDGLAKIKKEAVADMIGDYLFTDSKFVNHLSAGNPNVFQKIYGEIKHLWKMATAGSQQAKQLEKLKYTFEKALRERGNVSTTTEGDSDVRYSIRKEAPPKNTKKAYKLMRLVDGKLYPLFIGNNEEVTPGTWYNADSPNLSQLKDLAPGTHLVDMKTGEAMTWDEYAEKYVPKKDGKPARNKPNKDDVHWANDNGYRFMHIEDKAGGKSEGRMLKQYGDTRAYYNWGVNGSSKSQTGEGSASLYALRPGWHFGEVPSMHQIGYGGEAGDTVRLDNQVWVEVEMSADVDYNEEAASNWGGDIPTHIPTDGYYKFATNPTQKKTKGGDTANDATKADWYVAGAFKVNRILSDTEADSVVNEYNRKTGRNVPLDYRRNGGRQFNAKTMQVEDAVRYSLSDVKQDMDALSAEDRKEVWDAKMRATYANSIAAMTDHRLDRAYSDFSYSNPTTTKGYFAYIDPMDFLTLTTSDVSEFLENNKNKLNEGVSEDWGTKNNIQESGILYLRVDENGNVIGHEGRHRMAALYRAGVEKVAVIVEVPRVENAKPIKIKKLFGQDFGDTKSYGQVYLQHMLPISKQYERINRYTYGTVAEKNRLADPNIRYSLSDSTGKQLSNEQQEYFKDSAIRDKDGNLMVLYHGTQNDFTVFDIGMSGDNYDGWSEYGEGIYLTPEKKTAEYYGDNAGWGREVKVMEVYANIRNPFNTNGPVDFDISDLTRKYNLTEYDERFMKKAGNRLIDFLKHHKESVRDYLTSKGFDGVWEKGLNGDVHEVVAYAENQVKNVDNAKPTSDPDIRYSLSNDTTFTPAEIQAIQSIGRKSINSFTSQDIAATEKFARKYWEEIGTKSPFYRAWFGDWRANETTPVQIATKQGDTRGVQKNTDTGWNIQVSGKVFSETRAHTDSYNIAARKYLPYINDIVEKAVLLDSIGVGANKAKSPNTLLIHSMYAVADIGNGPEVLKLYVEEINNPNDTNTTKRSYQLQNIEKYRPAGKSSQKTASSISPVVGNAVTVADLFAYVKQKDASFAPIASSKIVNADGTPKVMYHGSQERFTVFDKRKAKSSGLYGRGFYFTDSASHAGTYGEPYHVYLNIRNPLQSGGAQVGRNQVRSYIEAVAENEDYSIENYGTYDVDAILDTVMGKARNADAFKIIQDINATAIGDMVEAAELFNQVNGTTFDGIVVPTETVAFYPEQIKSATDNAGTFDKSNPDIRFSLSENDFSSMSYAEITAEQQKINQRRMDLEQRKREAANNPDLLQAMDDYSNLFTEVRGLLSKKRNGTATPLELARIEEIKALKDEYLQRVADLQESLGLNAIAKEETEIRETVEALRVASDAAWAREGAEKEKKAIEKAGMSAPDYFRKKALKAFKTTINFNEAGYLLPDGKMLNFSGGERNHRYRDHREIGEIYEATQGVAALNRFLNDGNIRVMAESPGIDIASGTEPTKEQYLAIRRFINANGVKDGRFFVDFSDADGRRAGNYAYQDRVNADRIINDIKHFYATGEIREQSLLDRFHHSLSEDSKKYGDLHVTSEDIRYNPEGRRSKYDFPIRKDIAPAAPAVQQDPRYSIEEMFPDDLAPVQQELSNLLERRAVLEEQMLEAGGKEDFDTFYKLSDEYVAVNDRIEELDSEERATDAERFASLEDADAPPEMSVPRDNLESDTNTPDPMQSRVRDSEDFKTAKPFMVERPEVKPFFQAMARTMLGDIRESVRGQRFYNDQVYARSGAENAWTGVSRQTAADIAELLDDYGYSYDQIENALNAIIEDRVTERHLAAKNIEFMLNDRLLYGYTDVWGEQMPANQAYIDLAWSMSANDAAQESFDSYMESVEDNLPPEAIGPVVERTASKPKDIAPIKAKEKYEAVTPKKQPRMVKATPEAEKIAKILDEEPTPQNKKSRAWARFKANVLDKGAVFEDLSLKTKNRELMGKWNFILGSEARAQRLMGNGAEGVKSLNAIREEVENSGKSKQFYSYLYHKHNIDRMQLEERYEDMENKPVFGYSVTAEKSREIVANYERTNPSFKRYAKDIYDYMNHLRKLMVDNGVISQDTADLWADMYPNYVPIRRAGKNGAAVNVPLDTGRTGVNAPVKKATGGNMDILPLFDTMALRTAQTYKAIAKNSFGVELKKVLGTTIEKSEASVDGMIDSVEQQEGLLQEGKNGSAPTFTVFENGEKVTFEITQDMYDALKPVSEGLAYTNKIANTISNFHRGLLTEYNPVFMLTNAIKDAQDVMINSQHPGRTYLKIPEAYAQLLTKGYWYNEYMENGGEQNTYFDEREISFDTERKGIAKVLDLPPFSIISAINNFIEMTPRLAEYIASREAGRSIEVSMLDAARVTTNFQAGGDLTKFLNRNGATFLNASVQGLMQNVRNFREAKANGWKGWANLATKFAVAGLPAVILNNLLWDDDDEYEELSDYVKQNYYVVAKYGDGKFVRIPKGRTIAVIQAGIEQIGNALSGDDEVDLNRFLELVVSNLAPNNPIEDNILAPIIQVKNNKTWYGEDLVPTRLQDLPAAEQYDESTDNLSKWLGEKLDISPVKINYLLDQYTGGVGDTFLPMMTPEAESGNDSRVGNLLAPLKSKFTTDSVMNNQNVSDFYDTKDELTTAAKSAKATESDVLKNKYMNSVNAELSELYAQKREIQNSSLPDSVKYQRVRAIQQQIVNLTKESLDAYDNISIKGDIATIGNVYFQRDDEGEWRKMTDSQVAKYKITTAAGDSNYATDGTLHYRRDENGEWTKISDKQLERQNEVTKELGITPEEYWNETNISFFPVSDGKYEFAYDNPENYAVAKSVGGYDSYKKYSSELSGIKADKDEDGKSISGSRKEKVIDYVNGLDIDYGMRLILFKNEYNADDTYNNEIIEYLNSRDDLSFSDTVTILRKLGFTVHDDGTIEW